MATKENSRIDHGGPRRTDVCCNVSEGGADEAAAAFKTLSRRLQRARGDARQILELVREAERAVTDQCQLCKIYNLAMRTFGPCPQQACPEAYGELSVKHLEVLCVVDPEEARLFHRFMMHYSIRQKDANVYLARARMEVRLDQPQRAAALLEEGLRADAQPAEPLRRLLGDLGGGGRRGSGAAVAPAARVEAPAPGPAALGTPLRPRELRYSDCSVKNLEEALAASAVAALPAAPGAAGAVPPTYGGRAAAPVTAGSDVAPMGTLGPPTARLSSGGAEAPPRVSVLESLSPILEAESVEDPSLTADGLEQQRRPLGATAGQPREWLPAGAVPAAPGSLQALPDAELSEEPSGTLSEVGECGGRPQKTFTVNGVPYARLQTIGRGGSSKVYEVRGPSGEIRALKRVVSTCPATFEAYANEVTLLQSLKEHHSVIHVYDAEVDAERLSVQIVMERGGLDLGRLLQQADADLTLGDMQALWRQMLEAVQAVHSERIVHSDLKPANFLLANGRLKLIDFGIAKRIAGETTNISRDATVGTISYMAPEAVRHGAVKLGRPSDIWSLGIILYQLAYRRSPFAHLEPMQRLFALSDPEVAVEFPPGHRLESHAPGTQALLIDVLERCLQRDPNRRASIPELLEHPFLKDNLRLSRAPFDRAVEALVAGFYAAAREVLGEEQGEEGAGCAQQDRWQCLSDEVWERLSRPPPAEGENGGAVAERPVVGGSADFAGLAAFRECLQRWVARGDAKRQRTGATVSEAPSTCRAVTVRPGAPPGAAPPPAPAARARPPPPPPPQRPAAARAPLGAANSVGPSKGPAGGPGGGFSSVQEELLLKQRSILRKTTPAAGKENAAGADQGAKAGESVESLVLRRLRDRRALVEDQRADEEQTEFTGWAH